MIRKLATIVVPPALLSFAQRTWQVCRGMGFHTFEGGYTTITEVPCGKEKYNDEELTDVIVRSRLRAFAGDMLIGPISDDAGFSILPLIYSQMRDRRVNILDFGGGPFVGLASLLNFIDDVDYKKLSYTVVETPAMCKSVRNHLFPVLLKKFGQIEFLDIVDSIPKKFGSNAIIFIGSTIQYITAYEEVLKQLAVLNASTIIVAQTPFTEGQTYARQQLNMPGKKLATWVFNRTEFINLMSSLGYKLNFRIDHDLPLTYRNAPAHSVMSSMVFNK